MKQTCQQCKWYYYKPSNTYNLNRVKPPACYYKGKWAKWLKKDSVDKPNNCDKYSI